MSKNGFVKGKAFPLTSAFLHKVNLLTVLGIFESKTQISTYQKSKIFVGVFDTNVKKVCGRYRRVKPSCKVTGLMFYRYNITYFNFAELRKLPILHVYSVIILERS